jgi:hypothetical protein
MFGSIDRFSSRATRVVCACVAAAVLIFAMSIAATAAPKQMMLLHTFGFQAYEEYARN